VIGGTKPRPHSRFGARERLAHRESVRLTNVDETREVRQSGSEQFVLSTYDCTHPQFGRAAGI
jgi:hypothetical protein